MSEDAKKVVMSLLVDVADDGDKEMLLLSAVIQLFTSHPATSDLTADGKSRIARYVNERFALPF